ncbi:MAG: hypothetical protein WAO55_13550 [Candidatus Manganitrophaceae bacterium]
MRVHENKKKPKVIVDRITLGFRVLFEATASLLRLTEFDIDSQILFLRVQVSVAHVNTLFEESPIRLERMCDMDGARSAPYSHRERMRTMRRAVRLQGH